MRLLALLLLLFCSIHPMEEKPFVIVIPSYRNKDWYKKNLDSVFNQNYSNYRVIYLDDASPDDTGKLVEKYIKDKNQENKVTLIKNTKRVGALANLYTGVHLCKPNEIVCTLDGDDWFSHDKVLQRLNKEYKDPEVWLTYGQHEQWFGDDKKIYPGGAELFPKEILQNKSFRQYKWVASQLRTFYAGLFHLVKIEDLLIDGEFLPMAYDYALMYPMLEMACDHIRFIPDVLYVYNLVTPINDVKVNYQLQQKCCREIKLNKKPYKKLETASFLKNEKKLAR